MKLKKRFGVVLLMAMLVMAMTVTASAAAKLNKTSVTVGNGQGFNLKVKGAKGQEVKWSSSNRNVATVEEGAVTTLKGGKATIRAKVGKKTLKCKVTVESVELTGLEGVALSGSVATGSYDSTNVNVWNDTKINDYLKGTTSVDLKPYVKTYPNTLEAAWSTSNAKVATVENGVVKAVANGRTKVSLTSKDGKAAASVVVVVTGMGNDDEDANPVVITTANYDRLWNKYFGKAKISYVYLDEDGNLLNEAKFDGTIGLELPHKVKVVENGKEVEKTVNDNTAWNDYLKYFYTCYSEMYMFYIKDARVDALKTDGYGDFRFWVNQNNVTVKGGTPVLTQTAKYVMQREANFNGFGSDNVWDYENGHVGQNGYGSNWFGYVEVDKQESTSFNYYTSSVNVNDPSKEATTKHTGTYKVIVSDPTIAGKTVLGFVYGYEKVVVTPKDEGTVEKNGVKVPVMSYTYTMDSISDETFKTLQVNLYLNK